MTRKHLNKGAFHHKEVIDNLVLITQESIIFLLLLCIAIVTFFAQIRDHLNISVCLLTIY